jgi:hypothetical protein
MGLSTKGLDKDSGGFDMQKLSALLWKEIQELIPPTIFFFIAFNLLAFTNALNLKQYGISLSTFAIATLGALVVGKVVLITDKLPFINQFPDKPLIYNVVWKTIIYALAAFLIRYLERLIHFLFQYGSLSSANRHLFEEVVWPHFWAIQIWLLVLLFLYCGLRELIRVVGRHTVVEMFFGRKV